MATSTPARGRIPVTGIPTPGSRLRSPSCSTSSLPAPSTGISPNFDSAMDRAFAEAMKANDPSRFSRSVSGGNSSTTGASSMQHHQCQQRPPSSASASASGTISRPKTPNSHQRNGARRSDGGASDASHRASPSFVVGDSVRIESLGFEGTLRYVGEIEGKPGDWAGVELSGGFAGLGKNNGSVGNKRYFPCPEKCGVFIAYSKLSSPTVNVSGSSSRPSSASSSRHSMSGRVTPSYVERSTPNTGRTSGRVTPSSGLGYTSTLSNRNTPRNSSAHTLPTYTNTSSASAMSKITAGSRASRYVGVTAQQLSARKTARGSGIGSAITTPTKNGIGLGSPAQLPASPSLSAIGNDTVYGSGGGPAKPRLSSLPKSFGSGRPSLSTPKTNRMPSAIAMPPPPSPPNGTPGYSISLNDKPSTPTYSTTSNDTAVDDETIDSLVNIQKNSRALQDKIQSLILGKSPTSPNYPGVAHLKSDALGIEFDDVVKGIDSSSINAAVLNGLRDRCTKLEDENACLKLDLDASRSSATKATELKGALQAERDRAQSRVQELESSLKTSERTLSERNTKIESLERSVNSSAEALENLRAEGESRAKTLQAKIDDCESLIASLKDAIEVKSNEAGQNEGLVQAKNAEISLLEARVKKADIDLEETRRDLSLQIDELRHAGQETIALYEERLASAETMRYELEDLAEQLEGKLAQSETATSSEGTNAGDNYPESAKAMRIDNEMLREQVLHLQAKIQSLEDSLGEAQLAAEKEEAAVHARLQRFKEGETAMRNEIMEVRKEMEALAKSERLARGKTEEAEEALRENTLALENARAEIEGLRAEVASLESLQSESTSEKTRSEESSRRAALERNRHTEEVTQLKELLEAAKLARKEMQQQLETAKSDAMDASNTISSLKKTVGGLGNDRTELEQKQGELTAKLERERSIVAELRQTLEERTAELESSRKSTNRDRPINLGLQDMQSISTSPGGRIEKVNNSREEIQGLKLIIQELQHENSAILNRNKHLEAENSMLAKETESLREDLKILEENIDQSLQREESDLASSAGTEMKEQSAGGEQSLLDLKAKHDADVDQLRKKLTEAEKKNAKTIHDLNKEVNELESLIEAKIYREDELEREIERLTSKLNKTRLSSSNTEPSGGTPLATASSRPKASTNASASDADVLKDTGVCEICEQPGHDIFSCHLLRDGSDDGSVTSITVKPRGNGKGTNVELFCDDCESHGHIAKDCPHSLDVF